MSLRERLVVRLTAVAVRWGFLEHRRGRTYVREHYTLTGRYVEAGAPGRSLSRWVLLAALTAASLFVGVAAGGLLVP